MAWYPASYPGNGRLEERSCRPGFLLPFGRRPSLLGHPVPATEFGSPYGRLTGARAPDLDGVSMFRTREMRLGEGRPLYPGDGGAHTAAYAPRPPPAASQRRVPYLPGAAPGPGSHADEASSRISG